MPFSLIKGRFVPGAGIPDGDSVRFRANNNNLWKGLEGRPAAIGIGAERTGTVQLRLEGIDSIEKAATKPLATEPRENLSKLLGSDTDRQDSPGYVLCRMTEDRSHRPIAFAFQGSSTQPDGSDIRFDAAMLRR